MKKVLLFPLLFITSAIFISCTEQPSERVDTKVLLISVDGFMNAYLDRNDTPNFDRFISEGVKAEKMIPIFPTKTFPNHFSLVTGLFVENHGIISNSFPDENLEGHFSYGPQDSENDERWWQGEPIWIAVENQGKTSATMFWPGSEASFDGVRPTRWKDYDGSFENSARIDTVMSWLDPAGDVNADFATLYFSHVDSEGHSHGPNSVEVDRAVVNADSLLGYLMEQVEAKGLTNNLDILITSDHGMAELSEDKVIFLDEIIDLDDVEVIDWSPVALLQPIEGKKEDVYNSLKENEENFRVYYRDDLPSEYGFSSHPRIPEIIMMADVPYSITSRSFFESRGLIAGTHGYDHLAPEMATSFFAKGPSIMEGETIAPFQSIHIYELMTEMLQINPSPNDGSLDSLRHVLK